MFGSLFAIAMTFAAQAGTGVQVDVGRANWGAMPQLQREPRPMVLEPMVRTVETILRERQCSFAGQTAQRFNITVPYAVQLQPDGGAARILVGDVGCRPLETYVGSLAMALAAEGNFRATRATPGTWYGSSFNFNVAPN